MNQSAFSHQNCVFYNGPLGFFNRKISFVDGKDGEHFTCIVVFKSLEYNSKKYPQGAMIGIITGPGGAEDMVFRGEIFESMSVREQLILVTLFQVFVTGGLRLSQRYVDLYATLPLTKEQQTVRPDYIKLFQEELFNIEQIV
jgi:hypothetical protein